MYSVYRYKHSQTLVMAGKKLIRDTIRDLQKVFFVLAVYLLFNQISPADRLCKVETIFNFA